MNFLQIKKISQAFFLSNHANFVSFSFHHRHFTRKHNLTIFHYTNLGGCIVLLLVVVENENCRRKWKSVREGRKRYSQFSELSCYLEENKQGTSSLCLKLFVLLLLLRLKMLLRSIVSFLAPKSCIHKFIHSFLFYLLCVQKERENGRKRHIYRKEYASF